jgi:hypothetical protein
MKLQDNIYNINDNESIFRMRVNITYYLNKENENEKFEINEVSVNQNFVSQLFVFGCI